MINDNDYAQSVSLAPAQFNKPTSILLDKSSEPLTFIKIYGGIEREEENKFGNVTYAARCKSEFRRYDRRCAVNVSKVFYSYKKLVHHNLLSAINISMKKTRMVGMTKEDAIDPEKIKEKLFKNEAYQLFKSIRSSPSYWENRKKDINAMIRQTRKPDTLHHL